MIARLYCALFHRISWGPAYTIRVHDDGVYSFTKHMQRGQCVRCRKFHDRRVR